MANIKYFNNCGMDSATTGIGNATLGSALASFQTAADAGVVDADEFLYSVEDGSSWEFGIGSYTATGTILVRTDANVEESSNSDNRISLSGSDVKIIIGIVDKARFRNVHLIHTLQTTSYTAARGELVMFDISSASADVVFTLPTPTFIGQRATVVLEVEHAVHDLNIEANGTNTIEGNTTDPYAKLVIGNFTDGFETMTFVSTTLTNWNVEYDGRIACKFLAKFTSAPSTNTAAAWTITPYDDDSSDGYDIGEVYNTSTFICTPRRDGNWVYGSGMRPGSNVTLNHIVATRVRNTTSGAQVGVDLDTANSADTLSGRNGSGAMPVVAGDSVQSEYYLQTSASIGFNSPESQFWGSEQL